jgi:3'-phosphoadenosine 5'-phosphosulfate (PAPS) 3'-phosphatase
MGQNKSSDVVWHHATVTRERHEALNGHSSVIVVHRPFRVPGNPSCGRSLTLFLQQLGLYELTSMGSSLKLCLVAEGNADVYPRPGSPHCRYRKLRTPIIMS